MICICIDYSTLKIITITPFIYSITIVVKSPSPVMITGIKIAVYLGISLHRCTIQRSRSLYTIVAEYIRAIDITYMQMRIVCNKGVDPIDYRIPLNHMVLQSFNYHMLCGYLIASMHVSTKGLFIVYPFIVLELGVWFEMKDWFSWIIDWAALWQGVRIDQLRQSITAKPFLKNAMGD